MRMLSLGMILWLPMLLKRHPVASLPILVALMEKTWRQGSAVAITSRLDSIAGQMKRPTMIHPTPSPVILPRLCGKVPLKSVAL